MSTLKSLSAKVGRWLKLQKPGTCIKIQQESPQSSPQKLIFTKYLPACLVIPNLRTSTREPLKKTALGSSTTLRIRLRLKLKHYELHIFGTQSYFIMLCSEMTPHTGFLMMIRM